MTHTNIPSDEQLPARTARPFDSDMAERLRSIFSYDPETGFFVWANPPNGCRARVGSRAGNVTGDGYRRLSFERFQLLEHRAAWIFVHGSIDGRLIDHINHDTQDNRISNLRLVDNTQNVWNNKRKHEIAYARPQTSGKGYESMIRHMGKRIFIGVFETKEAAIAAYKEKAKTLRGEYYA